MTGLGRGTIDHALNVLIKEGRVREDNGFFLTGEPTARFNVRGNALRLLCAVERAAGVTAADVAQRTGLDAGGVSRAARALASKGHLIAAHLSGRVVYLPAA